MKRKTSELEGANLDAAVALVEGRLVIESDEHPKQPGYYRKTREEWGEHIVRWYARSGENADGQETEEEGGWEPLSSWGSPSTDWADGGPIIERERIGLWAGESPYHGTPAPSGWFAEAAGRRSRWETKGSGPTPLIAAMRAYVASKFGAEVDLPEVSP